MKEKLMNNLPLKLLSIGLAFLVWLSVLYIANPIETKKVRVNVDVINEEVLTKHAKTYDAGDLSAVYVEVNVRKLDRDIINPDSFRATIDLSKLYDVTSAVPINIEVVKNHDLIEGEPVAVPKVIMVKIEGVMEKKFNLETNTSGEPPLGYTIGEIDVEPNVISLKGAESVIGRISSVGIEMDVAGATSDLHGETVIVCYDANHNPLKLDYSSISPSQESVSYFIKVLTGKSLPLEYEVGGEPAKGYKFVGAESKTKSIAITGSNEAIESISSILIPKDVLNVSGLTDNKTVKVDIRPYLPRGVTVEGSGFIDVILKIEAKSTQSITLNQTNITVVGQNPRYTYDFSPSNIVVNVSGLTSDVNTINANSLGARINVSGLAEGNYPGSITFNNPDNIEIDSNSPFVISVREAQGSSTTESISQTSGTETKETSTEALPTLESVTEESSVSETAKQETTAVPPTSQGSVGGGTE